MLYKRGRVWWFKFVHNGKRIQESTRTRDKKKAEKIYHKVRAEIADRGLYEDENRMLKELVARYESEYTPKKKDQVRDRCILKKLSEFFGEHTLLKDIEKTIGDYESFRTSEGASPATIVKELGLLRRIFNVAIKKWRWVKDNPVALIEMPTVNNERVRYLSPEELRRLQRALNSAPEWLRSIVVIAKNTGLRQANLINLTWSQVSFANRMISIEGLYTKNGENLGIPLTLEAFEILESLSKVRRIEHDRVFHADGKPICKDQLYKAFNRICKVAEITDFRFHDLRHHFASYLRQNGVDLHTISKLLSHKDTRMTQRYAHLSVDSLRQAVAVFDQLVATEVATVQDESNRAYAVSA